MNIETTLRNAPLPRLVDLLKEQADVRYDVAVPAGRLHYSGGNLHVVNGAVRFTDDADVLSAVECDAVLAPTDVFEEGISHRLGIPRAYLRTLRGEQVSVSVPGEWDEEGGPLSMSLLDANVNGWFEHDPARMFLVRAFRTDDPDAVGIARAFLSNKFAIGMDNYDVLLAALAGAKEAGLDPQSLDISADLSERQMRVKIHAPEITALAPILLGNYRSPFARSGHGQTGLRDEGLGTVRDGGGSDLPVVEAGVVIGNSETGGGAWTAAPNLRVRICSNGMTHKADALREVHVGGRLEEGVVTWSTDTQRKNLDLIVARTRDAVATFLDADYVQHVIDEIEAVSATPVDDVLGTIERVAKVHVFSEAEQASILDCFIKSGDTTAGGVMQAVTAAAQMLEDPDRAGDFEDMALDVLATAAKS